MIASTSVRLLCATMLSLCAVSSVSPFFYSTVLNTRARNAHASALATKNEKQLVHELERVKKFSRENLALSTSSSTVSGVAAAAVMGLALFHPRMSHENRAKFALAAAGTLGFLTIPALVSAVKAGRDFRTTRKILKDPAFVRRLLQSPTFCSEILLHDPLARKRTIKKMELAGTFTYALKPIITGAWRKRAKIKDMVFINKKILEAIEDKQDWLALFAREDAEAAVLAHAAAQAPAVMHSPNPTETYNED